MSMSRRVWVEVLTVGLFVLEFLSNVLRFVGMGRRYYNKQNRLDGRLVVITGANSGIGKETAYQLCSRGAKVILACRSLASGHEAAEDIRKRCPKAFVTVATLDLASFESIQLFANNLRLSNTQVDILINNAGVMLCPQSKSKENIELHFATNHLGHFLLTHYLLPLMTKSPDARIINISSVHHVRGRIFFDDINFDSPGRYDPVEAYCQSKMANVLFTQELAKRLKTQPNYANVKTYALNPGTINTNLTRHVVGVRKVIFNLIGTLFNLDIYSGTQTTIYCALEPSLRHQSGQYYSNCKQNKWIFKESTDEVIAKKLWNLSCEMIQIEPEKYFG